MIDKASAGLGGILTGDPALCFLSLLLLLLWLAARALAPKPPFLRGMDWERASGTLLRVVCGFILAGASLDKLGDAPAFFHSVAAYQVLPPDLVPLAAVVIPWLEFFAGLALALGFLRRGAALLFCGLMAVYTFSLSWALLRGIELSCSCFSTASTETATWLTVLRDVLFLGMGLIVWVSPPTYAALGKEAGTR